MVGVITDPLVHMVRNSVDHGIESAAERKAAGKPEHGTVRLAAQQTGGSVVVTIEDDGKGLDKEKLLAKAKERGLLEGDKTLTDSEIFNLVFLPGLSTAAKVTDISGRGVGMDVVKRAVESLRGRIEIASEPGKGTKFSIHLPLTLAITDGMLVRIGTERYIVPTMKIQVSLRPTEKDIWTVSGKGEMVMLHGQLIPIARLHRLFALSGGIEDPTQALLVVVGDGSRKTALLVDELLGQQQFVVKPLTGQVAQTPGVAGGAILGDGGVGLILDPEELIELARGTYSKAAEAA
jgi:two-component system chemotaxis sensor kinase CheA